MKSLWNGTEEVWDDSKVLKKAYGILYTLFAMSVSSTNPEFNSKIKNQLEQYIEFFGLSPRSDVLEPPEPDETYEGRIAWFCGGGLVRKIRCGKFDKKTANRFIEIMNDAISQLIKRKIIDEKTINLIFYWKKVF